MSLWLLQTLEKSYLLKKISESASIVWFELWKESSLFFAINSGNVSIGWYEFWESHYFLVISVVGWYELWKSVYHYFIGSLCNC